MTPLWAALAGILAVTAETMFKRGWDWLEWAWLFIPMAALLNYCIYRTVTGGGTLIVAIAGFSLATLVARALVSQFLLNEPLTGGNFVALACLATAVVVGRMWK